MLLNLRNGVREWFWNYGKVFLGFGNHLDISPGLFWTKKEHFFVYSSELEKWYSSKQGASKFTAKISKTEVEKNVKLSVFWTGSAVLSSTFIELNVNKVIITNSAKKNYSDPAWYLGPL